MIETRIDIYGDNRFPEHTKVREACRGIVIRGGMILMTYEVNTDQWFIPGGGLEGEETIEACCIRELAEETGFVVNPLCQFATINEYCPTYIKGGCKGCVDEHSEGDCYTRDCVLKQGIACCGACEQFPCDTIMTKPHTTVLDKDWLRWKKECK